MLNSTVREIGDSHASCKRYEAPNNQQDLVVPLSIQTIILRLSIDDLLVFLYRILCLAFYGHVHIVVYLQGISVFFARRII